MNQDQLKWAIRSDILRDDDNRPRLTYRLVDLILIAGCFITLALVMLLTPAGPSFFLGFGSGLVAYGGISALLRETKRDA